MNSIRSAMFCLALVAMAVPASTPASARDIAQVVTREISQQPVETTITRFPDQTVITRRPLPSAGTIGVEPGVAPAYSTYGTVGVQAYPAEPAVTETVGAPVAAAPVGTDVGARRVRTITVRPARRPGVAPEPAASRTASTRRIERRHVAHATAARVPPAHVPPAHVAPAQTVGSGAPHRATTARHAPATRAAAARRTRVATTRRVGRPLVLTPTQRRTIYRSVVERQVVPAATEVVTYPATEVVAPATEVVAPPSVTTGYAVTYPAAPTGYPAAPPGAYASPIVYPPNAYASAGYPVTYTVGSLVPASVPLAPVPRAVVLRVPQVEPYQYAVVNDRVLLVDPATGTVVADVTP